MSANKKEEELEIRIYGGADADFELYEDDNKTYAYENGIYSLIRFRWDDQKMQLSIYDKRHLSRISSKKFPSETLYTGKKRL